MLEPLPPGWGRPVEILETDAKRGQLDPGLLGVFVEAGVWRPESPR